MQTQTFKTSPREEWTNLGYHEIEVQVPLTKDEKIELGARQTEGIFEVRKLEMQFTDVKKDWKERIDKQKGEIKECAFKIRQGTKPVPKTFPCYYDSKNHVRHYVDPETNDIVETRPAYPDDRQMSLV